MPYWAVLLMMVKNLQILVTLGFPSFLIKFGLGNSNIGIFIVCGPSIRPVTGLYVLGHQAEVPPEMKPEQIFLIDKGNYIFNSTVIEYY